MCRERECQVLTHTAEHFKKVLLFNLLSASVAHVETSQLICTANQLTGFYVRATLALNGLRSWSACA